MLTAKDLNMTFSIEFLRKIAMIDQCDDEKRPWTYTRDCYSCGGVKKFLDWLETASVKDIHQVPIDDILE